MSQTIKTTLSVPIYTSFSRRDYLVGLVGAVGLMGISKLTSESKEVAQAATNMNVAPEVLLDDITPVQKEIRRLLGIADAAVNDKHLDFSCDEVLGLSISAGFDFVLAQDGGGEALRPMREIRVERRLDGAVVVFEGDALEGVTLISELNPPSPKAE